MGISRLLRGEAVEEAVAAGALQITLAAAAVRAARGMRRVPGLRHVVVAQALPVGVADHRRALTALRPVAARAIVAGREGGAVRLGAGEDVVHVRRVAAAVDLLALLRQRRVLGEVVLAVELGHVLRDDGALGVLPGAAPDAVARVDGAGPLRAQVRVPRFAARARRLRERLTGLVRAGEAAEVGALARAGAGHEKLMFAGCACAMAAVPRHSIAIDTRIDTLSLLVMPKPPCGHVGASSSANARTPGV